jgi:hypothetical protein
LRFGADLERISVAVEAESAGRLQQLQARLIIPEKHDLGGSVSAAIHDVEGVRSYPLSSHDLDGRWAGQSADLRAGCHAFQP